MIVRVPVAGQEVCGSTTNDACENRHQRLSVLLLEGAMWRAVSSYLDRSTRPPPFAAMSDPLAQYRAKRDPGATPEPFGGEQPGGGTLRFVVQKHAARNLHYDLRLELDGVLKSWAVPKGPSYDQANKRGAFQTEDHPLAYADFEGVIPKGNYGAGEMIVWDQGTWVPIEDPHAGFDKGKLLFELRGHKLRGRWTLVKTKRGEKDWLLIKERDALMRSDADDFDESSVLSGLTLEELRAGVTRDEDLQAELEALDAPHRDVRISDCAPMLAERATEVFDHPDWIYEFKFDGYRFLALKDGDRIVLQTRNGHDWTASFPDIARALARLPYDRLIVDGEITVHDDVGLPSFQRLQKRARLKRAPDIHRAALELPATYYLFDLLSAGPYDVRPLPLVERKRLLRMIVPASGVLRFSDHVAEHGTALFGQVESLGLEGIIAKRADSVYRAGRSSAWQKVRSQRTDEFVVVGWKRASDNADAIGSLHLGLFVEGTLRYAGSVGTGFDGAMLRELKRRLSPTVVERPAAEGTPRDRNAVWVEPALVVEVRYLEWTDEGLLRHPVFLRIRDDKRPEECVRGSAPGSMDASEAAGGARGDDAVAPAVVEMRKRSVRTADAAGATNVGATNVDVAASPARSPRASRGKVRNSAVSQAPAAGRDGATHEVKLTNLDKVYWPEDGYTKGDLVEYYRGITPWLLPYLKDRPLVMTRFPDGIHGKSFFQKDLPKSAPSWLHTETLWSEGSERELRYLVGGDEASILWFANAGSIPLHLWASRVGSLDQPDWCILDLDPKDAPFEHVVEVAIALKAISDEIGLPCFIKTSGSSGLHVMIPLGGQLDHEQSKQLGELIARVVVRRVPDIATIERVIAQRGGRVYVDYLQNGHGKLLVSPFCVRPLPGAPVSMPLEWREVNARLDIRRYTIRNAAMRMKRLGHDPLRPMLEVKPDLMHALQALSALM